MMQKTAIFSPCRKYRYALTGIWNSKRPHVLFVCLNPSTADENFDDPTVRRCIRYVFDWGYGGMIMSNIFALRSTNPKKLYQVDDPVGEDNDSYLKRLDREAGLTVVAWGTHGRLNGRGESVLRMLRDPHYLKLTKEGIPGHPLYLRKDLKPVPFRSNHPTVDRPSV